MSGSVEGQLWPQAIIFCRHRGECRAESYVHESDIIVKPVVIGTDEEFDLDAEVVLALVQAPGQTGPDKEIICIWYLIGLHGFL